MLFAEIELGAGGLVGVISATAGIVTLVFGYLKHRDNVKLREQKQKTEDGVEENKRRSEQEARQAKFLETLMQSREKATQLLLTEERQMRTELRDHMNDVRSQYEAELRHYHEQLEAKDERIAFLESLLRQRPGEDKKS